MRVTVCQDDFELALLSAQRVQQVVQLNAAALLCFPAGQTALGTFAALVALENAGKLNLRDCKIVGLDDWAQLGAAASENCWHFLHRHFLDQLVAPPRTTCFFAGESADLAAACAQVDDFLANHGPIDLLLLGVGLNGHLGLNEPGAPLASRAQQVALDPTTQTVGQKYFSQPVMLRHGLTLGLGQLLDARRIVVQLSGEHKRPVAQRLWSEPPHPGFPATLVKNHPQAELLIDVSALGALDPLEMLV